LGELPRERANAVAGPDRTADELDLPRARRGERERARARGDVEPGERLGQADALGDLLEPQSVRPVGKAGHGDLGGPRLGERDRPQVVYVQALREGLIVELEHHAVAVERRTEIVTRPF